MQLDELGGRVLGHYRLKRPLGYGGSAAVFLADDIHLQRAVALKIFLPRAEETSDFMRRFAREARVLAQLDHPHILPVYDYGEQDDLAYLVMPYMAGGSLRDRLREQKAFSPTEAVALADQMLDALQYAHAHGLIHRDIKPGNMLFKANGSLVLSDFGLVKVLPSQEKFAATGEETISVTHHAITGTPDYMAPEQIQGKPLPATDIYAMGVVLYEMLTGERPFKADNALGVLMQHLYEQPQPLHEIKPGIPPALEAVIMRALEKDPARRYQQAAEFRQALQQALVEEAHSLISGTATVPVPPAAWRSSPVRTGRDPVTPSVPPISQSLEQGQRADSAAFSQLHQPAYQQPVSHFVTPPVVQKRRRRMPLWMALLLLSLVVLITTGALFYVRGWPSSDGPDRLAGTPSSRAPVQVPTTTGTVTKGGETPVPGSTATPASTPQPVPGTTTTCPPQGTARAAITTPLNLGYHQNAVYFVNDTAAQPVTAMLKRFDVTAGEGSDILKLADAHISDAQVSQDGQWILFTLQTGGQYQLRLVRVDGQGHQTLYCAPANTDISAAQWSFNQRQIIFNAGSSKPVTYLLNLMNGSLQQVLIPQGNLGYIPRTWLDRTRIYMMAVIPGSDAPPQGIYLLDLLKGVNQHDNDLQAVVKTSLACGDFDSSFDSTQLFLATCT
ncbi:MAG: serine/threonine protein kinase, partial [Ktedonobacteraceae bacterium]|nr:serine/threonine protein kinase [Ktedonobacteraceae bacterium]